VDGTGLGSCPVAEFSISGVEPSGSATRELVGLKVPVITTIHSLKLCC
jgi:hypothetical protein